MKSGLKIGYSEKFGCHLYVDGGRFIKSLEHSKGFIELIGALCYRMILTSNDDVEFSLEFTDKARKELGEERARRLEIIVSKN